MHYNGLSDYLDHRDYIKLQVDVSGLPVAYLELQE